MPREIRLTQPEITHCGVIFFSTKHLAGQVQVCTETQVIVYENIITTESVEHNNPLQENLAAVARWRKGEKKKRKTNIEL